MVRAAIQLVGSRRGGRSPNQSSSELSLPTPTGHLVAPVGFSQTTGRAIRPTRKVASSCRLGA